MERYTKLNRFDNTNLAGDLADNYSAWPAWRPAPGIRALGVPHPSVVFGNRMFTRLRPIRTRPVTDLRPDPTDPPKNPKKSVRKPLLSVTWPFHSPAGARTS